MIGGPGQILDGKKLQHPWWTVPLQMTASTALLFMVPAFIATEGHIERAGFWPLGIALFFGLCGMGYGRGFTHRARANMGEAFGITTLADGHQLTRRVHQLAARLGMPPPLVGTCTVMNAFAMKSKEEDATVVLGLPLMEALQPDEIDAVIGHELGHLVSNDSYRMQFACGYQEMFGQMVGTFADAMVRAYAKSQAGAMLGRALGDLGRVTVFLGSELLVMRMSRSREFYADAIGAALTTPDAMSRALQRLHGHGSSSTSGERRYSHLMFLGGGRLLSTHPTVERRLNALCTRTALDKVLAMAGARPAAVGGDATRDRRRRTRRREARPIPAGSWAAIAVGGMTAGFVGVLLAYPHDHDPGTRVASWMGLAAPASPGQIVCWGGGHKRITGTPKGQFIDYDISGAFVCGIEKTRGLECWGHGDGGLGGAFDLEHLQKYPRGMRARSVALNRNNGYVVDGEGRLIFWGAPWADLGVPPSKVTQGRVFKSVSVSGFTACAIAEDGSAHCWGREFIDATVANMLPKKNVDLLQVGGAGLRVCWTERGKNGVRCLILNETAARITIVPTLGRVKRMFAESNSGCAIEEGDILSCPNGGVTRRIPNIADMDWWNERCVIDTDGAVKCFKRENSEPFAVASTVPAGLRLSSIKLRKAACGILR